MAFDVSHDARNGVHRPTEVEQRLSAILDCARSEFAKPGGVCDRPVGTELSKGFTAPEAERIAEHGFPLVGLHAASFVQQCLERHGIDLGGGVDRVADGIGAQHITDRATKVVDVTLNGFPRSLGRIVRPQGIDQLLARHASTARDDEPRKYVSGLEPTEVRLDTSTHRPQWPEDLEADLHRPVGGRAHRWFGISLEPTLVSSHFTSGFAVLSTPMTRSFGSAVSSHAPMSHCFQAIQPFMRSSSIRG